MTWGKCRGCRVGAAVGVLLQLYEARSPGCKEMKLWDVLVDPARKIRVETSFISMMPKVMKSWWAEVVDNTTSRGDYILF